MLLLPLRRLLLLLLNLGPVTAAAWKVPEPLGVPGLSKEGWLLFLLLLTLLMLFLLLMVARWLPLLPLEAPLRPSAAASRPHTFLCAGQARSAQPGLQ
jgi:hypothetical protein